MKTQIINTQGKKIILDVDTPKKIKGIAFISHGLGGFKEQPHIITFSQTLNDEGFLSVRWDARNTLGESEGNLVDATLTNYAQDFNTVVDWASTQGWYQEPFIVCGHSLGAACALLFAIDHPKKVKALIIASAFISGLEFEKTFPSKILDKWKQAGVREWMSSSQPGVIKRIKWDFMEDAYGYDLLTNVKNLTQPLLLLVGSDDDNTPVNLQESFFHAVPSKEKEFHIIKGAEHTFKKTFHLNQIEKIIKTWIKKRVNLNKLS